MKKKKGIGRVFSLSDLTTTVVVVAAADRDANAVVYALVAVQNDPNTYTPAANR